MAGADLAQASMEGHMHSRRLSHNQTCLDMILLSPAADPQGGGGVFLFQFTRGALRRHAAVLLSQLRL